MNDDTAGIDVPADQVIDALAVQVAELVRQNAVLTVLCRQLQEGPGR